MRTLRIVALATVVVLSLAGCLPGTPGAGGSSAPPTASSTPTSTPTPTPTVAAPVKPTVAQLVVTAEGLGPLVMGSPPPATNPAIDILVFDPAGCPPDRGPVPGIWVTAYPEERTPDGKMRAPFMVDVDPAGVIRRIDVWSGQIRTDRGIAVGSSAAQVAAAYPAAEVTVFPNRADVYLVRGRAGTLLIEIPTMAGGLGVGFVGSIRVSGPTVPAYAISNTGNLVNPCTFM